MRYTHTGRRGKEIEKIIYDETVSLNDNGATTHFGARASKF